ncbi:hypothetical protein BGZ61DRAFT_438618 [Ilyonectria robusta]|uniref:uncharacterized protein n=1 Tax=Ilyonectria robusta TaxID=1079257 RepID=UPI001E8D7951|nr:uncharacterized protein BGZ61DRAFT_438618 [Ilyonectria robusta]KAH8737592.1 hypothetical protein BGZ61DRAFT_438618 [Ilyonectria robusta]
MAYLHLAHSLADAFTALADEVQVLTDRKTVLEHKLRFAHEQFQYLADKYAPAAPEIADTLAKLQLPSYTPLDSSLPVPLPRSSDLNSQHQIALVIRDGRRVANQLASLGEASKTTGSSRDTLSQTSRAETSMSTALEQDFTVEGKKGHLGCPFSQPATTSGSEDHQNDVRDPTPHQSTDPICAAMYAESTSQQARTNGSSAGKCPIRYMDKHSPAEIAHYVETHKHELPRSHEICLRRYQRDEDQVKKIDSKYGDIVSMIEGLGQLHQPMLPEADEEPPRPSDVVQEPNERVENWAQAVSVNSDPEDTQVEPPQMDNDRQNNFDRPLKEIRVGESPSRPWGIHVPSYEPLGLDDDLLLSPPAAPVRMPSPVPSVRSTQTPTKKAPGKCPFDHTKFAALGMPPPHAHHEAQPSSTALETPDMPSVTPKEEAPHDTSVPPQPTFINPDMAKGGGNMPQMIFTGPVFIGYPMDQAIQFMNQYRGNQ